MKNSTLVFRSLAVIILLAGTAQLATYASQKTSYNSTVNTEGKTEVSTENPETDFIVGKWKVNYNSKDFKGAVVYNIKKEGKLFNAYRTVYQDENGYEEKTTPQKTLIIKSFDGYKGKGVYKIDYEGKTYDVACVIDMVDESTFKLSYDYYGYGDTETWKRQ